MVEELITILNGSVEEAQCLLTIMRFMASECEDEGIVIEETIRESFYEFIDFHSQIIF
jgi:hypothetical protein